MPLSTEGNSSRTQRNHFIDSAKHGQNQPTSLQQRRSSVQNAPPSQFNNSSGPHSRSNNLRIDDPVNKKSEPNQFTSISDIPATMGDQRSTTPYLGVSVENTEENQKEKEGLISTHQLLMMTASTIPPLSNDADSQKQTTRSPIEQRRDFQSKLFNRKYSEQIRGSNTLEDTCAFRTQQQEPRAMESAEMRQLTLEQINSRLAQAKSTNEFRRKLGNLKEALSTIKTNLSSFKQTTSAKSLLAPSQIGGPIEHEKSCREMVGIGTGHIRNIAFSQVDSAVQLQPMYNHPSETAHSRCPSSTRLESTRLEASTVSLLQQQQSSLFQQQTKDVCPRNTHLNCCCSANSFSIISGNDQRSRSQTNLVAIQNRPAHNKQKSIEFQDSHSTSHLNGYLSKSNTSGAISNKLTPRLSSYNTFDKCLKQPQIQTQRPSQALNFSEINELTNKEQMESHDERASVKESAPQHSVRDKVAEDTFAKTYVSSSNHYLSAPLDNSSLTYKQCLEEATGKFVNPVSNNYGEDSSRNMQQVVHLVHDQLPSYYQSEQSGGETIEDVHRRHQNSILLEEYSKKLRQQTEMHNQSLNNNIMRKNISSCDIIQPLNLDRLGDNTNAAYLNTIDNAALSPKNYHTIEQETDIRHRRRRQIEQISNHMSCKHATVLSESKCNCCHANPNPTCVNTIVHNNRSSSTPRGSQICYTQRDDKTEFGDNRHERHMTVDHSTMIVHDSLSYQPEQHARLMPMSISSSVGQTLVSPRAIDSPKQCTYDDPLPAEHKLQHNSSKDQHPSAHQNSGQQFARSVSTPIIFPVGVEEKQAENESIMIEVIDVVDHQRRRSESRQDEKGSDMEDSRNRNVTGRVSSKERSRERMPGKIVRTQPNSNLKSTDTSYPQAQQITTRPDSRQQSRDQTKRDEVNVVDHSTYNQMRVLKKQLDTIQAVPDQQSLIMDKESQNRQLKQQLEELHSTNATLSNLLDYNQKQVTQLQSNSNDQLSQLARKEQLLQDLEMQVQNLREKSHQYQSSLKLESDGLREDISQLRKSLKKSEQEKIQLKYDLSKNDAAMSQAQRGDRIETHFIQDLMKIIGFDQVKVNFDKALQRLKKQQTFIKKIAKLVSSVEGRKIDSLRQCLKWVKGLLKDFISLRKGIQSHNQNLQQPSQPGPPNPAHKAVRENSNQQRLSRHLQEEECLLSPIGQNSHFSINIDSSGFLKQQPASGNRDRGGTSSSFSPGLNQQQRQNIESYANYTSNSGIMSLGNMNMPRQTVKDKDIVRAVSYDSQHTATSFIIAPQSNKHEMSSQTLCTVSNIIGQVPTIELDQSRNRAYEQRQSTPQNMINQPPWSSKAGDSLQAHEEQKRPAQASSHKLQKQTATSVSHVNIQKTPSIQHSGPLKHSRRSSGIWTARCSRTSEVQVREYGGGTITVKSKGESEGTGDPNEKMRKSSRSRSTRRKAQDQKSTLDAISSHHKEKYPIVFPHRIVTEGSCDSLGKKMKSEVASSTHDQLSRRQSKRQKTRSKKQPCQTTTPSHMTSSDQLKTLQTLPQNINESYQVAFSQEELSSACRTQQLSNPIIGAVIPEIDCGSIINVQERSVAMDPSTGARNTGARNTGARNSGTNSLRNIQQLLPGRNATSGGPYNDISMDMDAANSTMFYNQGGCFKGNNTHCFEQAQAQILNSSIISSKKQATLTMNMMREKAFE